MKKLSLFTSILLVNSAITFASADTLKEAISTGTTSGDVSIYHENTNMDTGADSGFTSAGVSLSHTTKSFNGFSAKIGFVAASDIDEKNDNDSSALADNSILSKANITYSTDSFSITAGRQAIDLEWMGDYHEGIVASTTIIPNTTLVVGYTDKTAVAGVDEISSEFSDVNGTKGAYVIDAKYSGLENIELNPYYYTASDVADFYGLKATYTSDLFNLTSQYAASKEDVSTKKDGSIIHVDLGTEISGISLNAGYIKTDKDGAIGSMDSFGDNINPFDDGTNVYGTDAKTFYGSASYTISNATLSLLYGTTDYSTNKDTDELNVSLDYAFTQDLSGNVLYVDYDDSTTSNNYDKIYASLTYSF